MSVYYIKCYTFLHRTKYRAYQVYHSGFNIFRLGVAIRGDRLNSTLDRRTVCVPKRLVPKPLVLNTPPPPPSINDIVRPDFVYGSELWRRHLQKFCILESKREIPLTSCKGMPFKTGTPFTYGLCLCFIFLFFFF